MILGNKRIPIEDLLSNLEVLIELALRALSPGINDLKVAQSCADFIGQSIALCVQREFPKPALFDTNNKLLVVTQEISFEDYLDAAISPLRQYSKKHISLSISLIRSLMIAYQINQNPAYKKPLEKHVNALYDSAMKQPLETLDYNEIEQVFKSFYNLRLANQLEI